MRLSPALCAFLALSACALGDDTGDSAQAGPAELDGATIFTRTWREGERRHGGDGLGPRYNAASCAACHAQGGPGGAGDADHDALSEGGVARPRVIADGVSAVEELLQGGAIRRRQTPALWGMGRLDALADAVLEAQEAAEGATPEVAGRLPRDSAGRPLRFGWKGDVRDLRAFVSRACANELGLQTAESPQPQRALDPPLQGVDLTPAEVESLAQFVAALPAPVQYLGDADAGVVAAGRAAFTRFGCDACHVETLGDVEGVYSDLLLHDMGVATAAVGGAYGALLDRPVHPGGDEGGEWRTPPLWGVADSPPYLHDGRATSFAEVILAHGGQGTGSRRAWRLAGEAEQEALAAFLGTLRAPG